MAACIPEYLGHIVTRVDSSSLGINPTQLPFIEAAEEEKEGNVMVCVVLGKREGRKWRNKLLFTDKDKTYRHLPVHTISCACI